MCDFSGLEYRIFSVGIISLFCGLICFIMSLIFKKRKSSESGSKKDSVKAVILGLLFVFISVTYSGYHIFKIHQPVVCVHEGYFIEERRNSRVAPPLPFTMQYTFTNDNQPNCKFYLDVFSKREIYDEEFEKNANYRIYYEEDTDIIVKVEKIE